MFNRTHMQLGPWLIAAVLLHGALLLAIVKPLQEQVGLTHATVLPRLNVLLASTHKIKTTIPTVKHASKGKPHTRQHLHQQIQKKKSSTPHRPTHPAVVNKPTALSINNKTQNTKHTLQTIAKQTITPVSPTNANLKPSSVELHNNAPASPPTAHRAKNPYTELSKLLHGAINRHKQYPRTALRMAWQGTASIRFLLQQNGQLGSLTLVHSSGYNSLDRAALQAVRSISPFEPAQHYLHTAQSFNVDVVFKLYE